MAMNKRIDEPCDFDKQSVRELRIYLRDRGAHVSGNRPELIKRAKGLVKLGTRPLREIQIEDDQRYKQRQSELFCTPLGEKIPEPKSLKGVWDNDLSRLPFFRTQDLYNYLVLNNARTFDSENMNAKRQLKAKVFYEDGHLHTVRYHKITDNCSHSYVKAKVMPSLPNDSKKKTDYEAWACLFKVSGNVHAAGCSCDGGEGESCNHVAALLYALVDISSKQKDGLTASTSSKCKWNQPRKRKLSPRKSQNLVFKKIKFDDTSDRHEKGKCKSVENLHNVKPLDITSFSQNLKNCAPHAAILLSNNSLSDEKKPQSQLPQLHKAIDFMYCDNVDLTNKECQQIFENYFDSLECSKDDVLIIERCTKGQNKSENWKEARYGRLTSSNFGVVFKQREDTKPENLLKTVMGYNSFDSAATRWGRSHEAAARRFYTRDIQKSHHNLKVYGSGLVVSVEHPY